MAGFILAASIAFGQAQPSFEVASIKPSNSADRRPSFNMFNIQSGGQFTAADVTVSRLIQLAYDVKDFQISGGPEW